MSGDWKPTAEVLMKSAAGHASATPWVHRRMMIDSGAFMSIVDHKTGKEMGFRKDPHDRKHVFHTDTGSGGYVKRDMLVKVGNHRAVTVPVAWAPKSARPDLELLIGRRGFFKQFDVTFSGHDHRVTFASTAASEAAHQHKAAKRINGSN
eukprot:TRINITY_DN7763_c1_g2_i1.p2 TRINITY_DN7763_c1_g2~~TRINITY_DN7763_c1_g2_i1.p2  ORF type:complete len:150 (+),score=29.69 TRINITY_DN7763_c1_g2_i1:109-558(+)